MHLLQQPEEKAVFTIKGLSFVIDGKFYAVDVGLIEKFIGKTALTPVPTAPGAVIGMVNLRGKVVTILSIAVLLGQDRWVIPSGSRVINAIIFKNFTGDGEQMGLEVDKPDDLVEIEDENIMEQSVPETVPKTDFVSGTAQVNGKTYRILDIVSIIDSFRDSGDRITEPVSRKED